MHYYVSLHALVGLFTCISGRFYLEGYNAEVAALENDVRAGHLALDQLQRVVRRNKIKECFAEFFILFPHQE